MNKFLVLIFSFVMFNSCQNKEIDKIYPSKRILLYSGNGNLTLVTNNQVDNYKVNEPNEDYYRSFNLLNNSKIIGEYVRRTPYHPKGSYIKYKDCYEIHVFEVNERSLELTQSIKLDFNPFHWDIIKNDTLIFSSMIDSLNRYPNKIAIFNIATRKTSYLKLFKDKGEYLDKPIWMSSFAISDKNEILFSYKNEFFLYIFEKNVVKKINGIEGRIAYFSPNYEEFVFTNNDSLFIYNLFTKENKFIYTIENKSRDQLKGGIFMRDSNKIYIEYIGNKDYKILTKFRNFVLDKNTKETLYEGVGNFTSFDLKYD